MNYKSRLEKLEWFPDYSVQEKYKLIQLFDNYHYQDNINDDKFIYAEYKNNLNSFKSFETNYNLINFIKNIFIANNSYFDIRIQVSEFNNKTISLNIITPYSYLDKTLDCDIKLKSNPRQGFFYNACKLNFYLIASDISPVPDYQFKAENMRQLKDGLTIIMEKINKSIYISKNWNSVYADDGYL